MGKINVFEDVFLKKSPKLLTLNLWEIMHILFYILSYRIIFKKKVLSVLSDSFLNQSLDENREELLNMNRKCESEKC